MGASQSTNDDVIVHKSNIRKFTSETREAVTKLSDALMGMVGEDNTTELHDMVSRIKDNIQKTEDEIRRLENHGVGPLSTKTKNLQRDELVLELHVQWVVVNAMWVVLASIAMASFMDDIINTYHDAIDELVTFTTKHDVTNAHASIEKLLENMKLHQQKVEGAVQEGMSKFPELAWDTPIFEAMKSPM